MGSKRVSSTKAAPSSYLVDDSDELCIFEFDEESQRRSHQKPSPVFYVPSTGRKQNSAHAEQREPKDSIKNDMIAQMTMAGRK